MKSNSKWTSQRSPRMLMVTWLVLALAVADANVEDDEVLCHPEHVHIAYGDSLDQIVIMWATKVNCSTELEYSHSEWGLNQRATGDSAVFSEQNYRGLQHLHRIKLTHLQASTTYFYRPMSNNIGSGPFYFKTPRTDQNWSPKFLVFGDLGVYTHTIPNLVEEALKGEYTALLHVGDFAYNLKDDDGRVGDQFMELIQPVAAYLPYMTAPGNHEIDSDTFTHLSLASQHNEPGAPSLFRNSFFQKEIDSDTFTHYKHRFSMPESPWPMNVTKLWYSFNIGPVHFISYSTEVFFTRNGSLTQKQFDWLLKDLKQANAQRNERPWIIAFGHRPMYCSTITEDDCTLEKSLVREGLEDLFYHYGVDIILEAHEHNYERLYPVYRGVVTSTNYTDMRAPVHIISGAAGSKHGADLFLDKPAWSAVRSGTKALQSYGRLHVFNTTHTYWEQRSVHNNTLIDALWIVQHYHGKFQLEGLPDKVSQQINQSLGAHGIPPDIFKEDESPQLKEEELAADDRFHRIAIGVAFGVLFSLLVVVAVATKVCRRRKYRAVRRWDTMDLDYGKKLFTPIKDEENDLEHDYEIDMADMNIQTKKLLSN